MRFMRSSFWFALVLFVGATIGSAQTLCPTSNCTAVTVMVTDSTSQVWANGTINYTFRGNGSFNGQYQWNGANLPNTYLTTTTVQLDSSGSATFYVPTSSAISPAGSSWTWSTCPNATYQCAVTIFPTVGSSENISSSINSSLGTLQIQATPMPKAYADAEILTVPNQGGIYYNTGLVNTGPRYFDGTSWQAFGAGSGSGCTPSGATNLLLKNTGGGNCGPSSISDNGTSISFAEPIVQTSQPFAITLEPTSNTAFSLFNSDGVNTLMRVSTLQNQVGFGLGITPMVEPFAAYAFKTNTGIASQSGTAVTGVGTSFDVSYVGGLLAYANGHVYHIIAAPSGTSMTVDTSATESSQAFSIVMPGVSVSSVGNVVVGDDANHISSNTCRLCIIGGSAGANVDIIPNAYLSDTANAEVEGSDYATNTDSIAMTYIGPTNSGPFSCSLFGLTSCPNSGYLRIQGATIAAILTEDAVPLDFGTNNARRMRIDATGNVGIGTGTTTLTSLLTVGTAFTVASNGNTVVNNLDVVGTCTGCGGSSTIYQVNGTGLTSSGTINFQNGTGNAGVVFSNPSAGIIQANLSLPIAGAGSGFTTGPNSGVTPGDLALFTGTGGQITDGLIAGSAVVTLTGTQSISNKTFASPLFTGTLGPSSGGAWSLTNAGVLTVASCAGCGGSSTAFQVNGSALTSATTVNFQNGSGNGGIVFSNPSAGIIQANLSLPIAGFGAGFTTGPTSTTNNQLMVASGTGGQITGSGLIETEIVATSASGGSGNIFAYTGGTISGAQGARVATAAEILTACTGCASLASPALTGTPTAPTATVGTNTTQIATTAFVLANAGGSGLSGMTAGQVPIAATATTVTSSMAIFTGGTSLVATAGSLTNGHAIQWSTANGISDAGYTQNTVARMNVVNTFTLLQTFNAGINTTTAILTAVAPTVAAAQVGFGSTTAVSSNCGTLLGGSACLVINVAGTTRYVPYY